MLWWSFVFKIALYICTVEQYFCHYCFFYTYLVFNVRSRREKGIPIFYFILFYCSASFLFNFIFLIWFILINFISFLPYTILFILLFLLFYLGERWTTFEWNRFPGQQLRWKGILIIYLFCHDFLSFSWF